MQERENGDPIWLNFVNEAITPDDQLANVLVIDFTD